MSIAMAASVIALAQVAWGLDPPHDFENQVEFPGLCDECHVTHNASYPTGLGFLCEKCHFEGGPATAVQTHSSLTNDNGYGDWDIKCWGCHDPHNQDQDEAFSTSYGKLIKDNLNTRIYEINPGDPGPYYEPISTLRIVSSSVLKFTSNTEFVDGDGIAEDDMCQVCHQSTTNYNGGGALNSHSDYGTDSQPGGDCSTCHYHSTGFGASGGGGCTGCHASATGTGSVRRQVSGTGGDFERTSHHVTDGTTTEIVTDADCETCHDQGSMGTSSDPDVILFDPDGGSSFTYDGNGSSIESFCLNCHDSDSSTAFDSDSNGGNGNQPFSDGRDPPDVATTWNSSSHGTTSVSVLADEKCLACHGGADSTRSGLTADQVAHGSDFAKLLSALVNGQTVTNGEEELCFACHDGLTAASDVEGEHAGTELYTDSSGALISTRHDVKDGDQTYSGAVIECKDCHDTHAADSSNKVIADPDPNDGVTPTAGNSWAGSTFLSEWCMDCHDNTYPNAVTAPTNALVDVATAFSDNRGDQHGVQSAGKNVNLRAGIGWARHDILECTSCHNPGHGDDGSGTAYPNLFNLRSQVYSKDGSTPIVADQCWDPSDCTIIRLLDASSGNTDATTNGKAWCSTCHPNPMGGNKTSGCLDGNCHHHDTNSF